MITLPQVNTPGSRQKSILINETSLTPAEVDSRLLKLGAGKRFLKAQMEDIQTEILGAVEGFFAGRSFFLYGPCGVGKTHVMVALIRKQVEAWREKIWRRDGRDFVSMGPPFPLFVSVPNFLLEIRTSFNGGNSLEGELIRRYSETETLLLDDLGVERPSEFATQTLYSIIDARYQNERQTVISSNLDLPAISERLSDRIASRIAEMCTVIKITGKDRRLKEIQTA